MAVVLTPVSLCSRKRKRAGECEFRRDSDREMRYDVIVAMDLRAHRYLKTVADRDQPEQLLYLPACPHLVHVPYLMPGERVKGAKLRE